MLSTATRESAQGRGLRHRRQPLLNHRPGRQRGPQVISQHPGARLAKMPLGRQLCDLDAACLSGGRIGAGRSPPEICATPDDVKLEDLSPLMKRRRAGGLSYGYDRFRVDPVVAPLQWPDDVLEQFLYDFGDDHFVTDYGSIDLCEITWRLETIPAADFHEMPTGASDAGCIDEFAENPVHWDQRSSPRCRPALGRARDVAAPAAPDRPALPGPVRQWTAGRGGPNPRRRPARPRARRSACRTPPPGMGHTPLRTPPRPPRRHARGAARDPGLYTHTSAMPGFLSSGIARRCV